MDMLSLLSYGKCLSCMSFLLVICKFKKNFRLQFDKKILTQGSLVDGVYSVDRETQFNCLNLWFMTISEFCLFMINPRKYYFGFIPLPSHYISDIFSQTCQVEMCSIYWSTWCFSIYCTAGEGGKISQIQSCIP